MENITGRVGQAFRSVLGIHPEVPANDGAVVLFLMLQGAQLLFVIVSFYAAAENTSVRLAAVPITLWTYLCLDGLYSAYTVVYYPEKQRVASSHGESFSAGLWRVGEQICATFVAIEGFLMPLLAAFSVHIPLVGTIRTVPFEVFTAAGVGVSVLAGSSMLKMIMAPSERRLSHNTILLQLSAIATVVSAALLINEFRGGNSLPAHMEFLYGTILLAYGAHNIVFSLLCPECEQRRIGHLIGLSFGMVLLAMLGLYFFGIGTTLPPTLFEYLLITAVVLFATAGGRSLFRDIAHPYLLSRRNDMDNDLAPYNSTPPPP